MGQVGGRVKEGGAVPRTRRRGLWILPRPLIEEYRAVALSRFRHFPCSGSAHCPCPVPAYFTFPGFPVCYSSTQEQGWPRKWDAAVLSCRWACLRNVRPRLVVAGSCSSANRNAASMLDRLIPQPRRYRLPPPPPVGGVTPIVEPLPPKARAPWHPSGWNNPLIALESVFHYWSVCRVLQAPSPCFHSLFACTAPLCLHPGGACPQVCTLP